MCCTVDTRADVCTHTQADGQLIPISPPPTLTLLWGIKMWHIYGTYCISPSIFFFLAACKQPIQLVALCQWHKKQMWGKHTWAAGHMGLHFQHRAQHDHKTWILHLLDKVSLHQNVPLQWRHNGRDGVSHHQHHNCLLKLLFRHRSKKTSTLHVTGLCARNSLGTSEFPAQMVRNTENVSIWWCHHA